MGTGLNFRNWVKKNPSSQDSWNMLHAHTLHCDIRWIQGRNGTGCRYLSWQERSDWKYGHKRVFTTLYGTGWLQSYNAINIEIPTSAAFCALPNLIFVICDKGNLNNHLPPRLENVKKTPISEAWPLVKLKYLPRLWKLPESQAFFVWVTGIF